MPALALWGICVVAAAGGHLARSRPAQAPGEAPAAIALLSGVPAAAFVPAHLADEVRAGGQATPHRLPFLVASLAALAGLPAMLRWRTAARGRDHQPLRARRHAISLRAPPLRFA